MKKIIALACDHAGYPLKEEIRQHFEKNEIDYIDFGCFGLESVNYPEYATKLCTSIQEGRCDLGILVCGTGIGMSMAANKHKGIRAACCSDTFSARMTRMHNDANVLCMGARVVGAGLAIDMTELFINTEYEGGRHQKRVDMVNALDK